MRWLIIVCLFVSCTDNTKIPKEIIPKAKMEKVIWDMMLADRFANDFLKRPPDSGYDENKVLKVYQQVFNVHQISKEEFLKSYNFYLGHPDIMRVMFDSISAQSERKRGEIFQDRSKRDSLRKAGVDSLKRRPMLDSIRQKLRKK